MTCRAFNLGCSADVDEPLSARLSVCPTAAPPHSKPLGPPLSSRIKTWQTDTVGCVQQQPDASPATFGLPTPQLLESRFSLSLSLSLSRLSTTRHSFPTHAHYDGPVVINLKMRLSLHSCQFFLGVIECLITFASSLLLSFAKNYGEDPNGLVFLFLLFHNLLELKLHREWKWNYICVGVVLW